MPITDFDFDFGPQYISPKFTAEKASPGLLSDWIDIWEDRMQGWWLDHVLALRGQPKGACLVMQVTVGLMEAMEIAFQGKSSDGASEKFFSSAFTRMFSAEAGSPVTADTAAKMLYKSVRCGLTHAAMMYGSVFLVDHAKLAPMVIIATPDGSHVDTVLIQPRKFVDVVAWRFREYVNLLRTGTGTEADERRARFEDSWHLLHARTLPTTSGAQP